MREVHQEIRAALPPKAPGLTPKEVHERCPAWARVSVRHALRELVEAGLAKRDGEPCRYRYWRAA